jgi:hypothetical protein
VAVVGVTAQVCIQIGGEAIRRCRVQINELKVNSTFEILKNTSGCSPMFTTRVFNKPT